MLKKLTYTLYNCNKWKLSQLSIIIIEAILGFLTLILLNQDITTQQVYFFWIGINVVNLILFFTFGTKLYTLPKKYTNIILGIIIGCFSLPIITSNNIIQLIGLSFSTCLLLTIGRKFCINSRVRITEIACKQSLQPLKLLSLSQILNNLLLAILLPVFALVYQTHPHAKYVVFLVITLIIAYYYNKSKPLVKNQTKLIKKEPIPIKVKSLLIVSGIYYSLHFISIRILIPFIILKATTQLNIGKNPLKFLGLLLAVSTIIGLIKIPKCNLNEHKLTIYCCIINTLIFGGIALGFTYTKDNPNKLVYIAMVISYLISNVTIKLWSSGFTATLKKQAEMYKQDYTYYLHNLSLASKTGSTCGFILLGTLYHVLEPEQIILILSTIQLIYVAIYLKMVKK